MKCQLKIYCIQVAVAAVTTACSADIPVVSLGIDEKYVIERMRKLRLESAFTGNAYRWTMTDPSGISRVVGDSKSFIFLSEKEGEYKFTFEVIDSESPYRHDFSIYVVHEEVEYSPYISKVYEYCPAPGQFVNEMPMYEPGDTYADMVRKAEESISGKNDIMISLGSYGGYVTFGFDHTIINVEGEKDFRIWGNAFYELTQPGKKGGSAEPGIVMVSYDENMNGIPDDPWYELAGSEYYKPGTVHNYSITYSRPVIDKEQVPDDSGFITDTDYIPWKDSEGNTGYVAKNSFHLQSYYPQWVKEDELIFSGTLLPKNGVDLSGSGTYYVLYSFEWGYADNHPNDFSDLNSFDIDWAVDSDGNPVKLPGADFIRVYTGLNQYCGWLGETSTEICRARDLHVRDFSDPSENPLPDRISSSLTRETFPHKTVNLKIRTNN